MSSEVSSQWQGRLAITGMGLVTPVGLQANAALAALRAGVSRLEALPGTAIAISDTETEAIRGAQVHRLTDGLMGQTRNAAMMKPALAECLQDADINPAMKLGLFLGTSGSHPNDRILNYDDQVKKDLLKCIPEDQTLSLARLIPAGRTSVLEAIRHAAQELDQGTIDIAVVGGSDSLVTPRTLKWLREQGKLPEHPRHTGTIPGEGAGFLALERPEQANTRGTISYSTITASAGEVESAQWGEANNGVALARAIRQVSAGVEDAHALVLSDLDGERYRAMEWAMAEPKGMWKYSTIDHWHPADCLGDAGAAMGALLLAWGSVALAKQYSRTQRVLVWGAADGGSREAVMLETNGVAP